MNDDSSAPQSTDPPTRSCAGWNLLWTVPVAIAADAVLAFIAVLTSLGNSAGTAANERVNGYFLSHAWVSLALIGLVTFAAVAIPPWHRTVPLRVAIAAAIALTVGTAVSSFALQ
jgi:hypothetical protein